MIGLGRFATKFRAAVEKGTRDADPTVRAASAGSLGNHQDEQAAIRLGEMLSDADESVRGGAIVGLQRANRPLSLALLAGVLDDTKQPAHIRTKAIMALADLHGYHFIDRPDPIASPERWAMAVGRAKALASVDQALKLYPRAGAKP
jgi:HEAT repeat protein